MKLNYKALCSSCRAGEHSAPADAFVTGYDQFNQRPFRGYLCDDHLDVVLHDGQLVNEKTYDISLDAICKAELGCTFDVFVKRSCYNPTLRGDRLARVVDAFNAAKQANNEPFRAYNF